MSRALDSYRGTNNLLSIMDEDASTRVSLPPEIQRRPLPTPSTSNAQSNGPFIDTNTMRSSQERAIVLFNPSNTPFFKSPILQDLSIIINSDFFHGLKDRLLWQRWTMTSIEDKATDNGSSR
ncbi:hypothetical protein CRYUN_Cryun02cG0077400 [Craigia yunnanensis]